MSSFFAIGLNCDSKVEAAFAAGSFIDCLSDAYFVMEVASLRLTPPPHAYSAQLFCEMEVDVVSFSRVIK